MIYSEIMNGIPFQQIDKLNISVESAETVLSNGLQSVDNNSIQWYSGNLFLKNGATGAEGDRFVFTSDGDFGVGTTTPTDAKFADAGKIIQIKGIDTTSGSNLVLTNGDNTNGLILWSGTDTSANGFGTISSQSISIGHWGSLNGTAGYTERLKIDTNGITTFNGGVKLGNTASTPTVKEMLYEGVFNTFNYTDLTISYILISKENLTAADSILTDMNQIIDYTVMVEVEGGHWYKENAITIVDKKQYVTYIDPNRIAIKFGDATATISTTDEGALLYKPAESSEFLRNFKVYIKYTV